MAFPLHSGSMLLTLALLKAQLYKQESNFVHHNSHRGSQRLLTHWVIELSNYWVTVVNLDMRMD